MADIKLLAANARTKLARGDALTEADAIRKAIIGKGISCASDVNRLMSQVGTQFNRDKRSAQRATRGAL